MMAINRRFASKLKGTKGVALPVALFGLIVVSILMTSALVTSSTELALSRAHQTGMEELYAADGALERFVAGKAAMVANIEARLVSGTYTISAPGGKGYSVTVSKLFEGSPEAISGGYRRSELFSLAVSPVSGRGRNLVSFLEVSRSASDLSFSIDSGLTLGGDAAISESATISDGSVTEAACDSASADGAIRHADGAQVSSDGSPGAIQGNVVQDTAGSPAVMAHMLNGLDLAELSESATFRFGPMFGADAFADNVSQSAVRADHRWGCPAQLVAGCTPEQSAFYPTIVIDAEGGIVDITAEHGQGMLLIRNGSVRIGGDFRFAGIIMVEGSLHMTGTSRIEGAAVAFDGVSGEIGDPSSFSGSSAIRFSQCEIIEAQRSLTIASLDGAPQTMESPTFAWFEVIR